MTVYLVGAGPGDPRLVTVRGAELLRRADAVVHDRLVDRRLLELAPPSALRIDVGKRPGESQRQERINELLVELGRAHAVVVRLKGGDPFVFGRGGEEAAALARAGVAFEVVPGVTSAFGVPAYAGIPVTHRGLSNAVAVVTGHVTDDADEPGGPDWELLARSHATIVVLMGVETRAEIARRLVAGGRSPDEAVAVVEWGATWRQRVVRTTLAGLGEAPIRAPAVIVVGPTAKLELAWAEVRPLHGWRVVLTRPRGANDELAALAEDAGGCVLELPVVALRDPPDGGRALVEALADPARFAWVVLTSARAVERLVAAVGDLRRLGGVKLAAVGPKTAEALVEARLGVDLVPARASGAGLVEAFPRPAGDGDRAVLYPRASAARPAVAEGLRAKGWVVEDVIAYETVCGHAAGPFDPAALAEARQADAVVFASPSAVQGAIDVLGHDGVPPVAVCIGDETAAAASAAGIAPAAIAAEPTPRAVLEALVAAKGSRVGAQ
jgi:uroporphyrinogen III methyltransferase/synthase